MNTEIVKLSNDSTVPPKEQPQQPDLANGLIIGKTNESHLVKQKVSWRNFASPQANNKPVEFFTNLSCNVHLTDFKFGESQLHTYLRL